MPEARKRPTVKLQRLLRRHWAFALLMLGVLLIGAQSMGCYLKTDDFRWMADTIEKAQDPLSAFTGRALWGSYYRPVASLIWLGDYALWGFEFRGYQALLILMWAGCVALIYGIGVELQGRLTGLLAAACVGLNVVYIQIVSWKSWFTTVSELFFVLLTVLIYMRALRRRSRRLFILAGVCAVAAVLSRELAPLVLSAVVFTTLVAPPIRRGGWSRRRAAAVGLWAVVSLVVLMALPAYRSAAVSLAVKPFRGAAARTAAQANSGDGSFSPRYFGKDLVRQLHTLYCGGFFPVVVLFVTVAEYLRIRRFKIKYGLRRHYIMAGAVVCLVVLARLLFWLWTGVVYVLALFYWPTVDVGEMFPVFALWQGVGEYIAVTLLWLWVAWRGGPAERMLAAWFVVSFGPILLLSHHSGAYQMLALTAMSLYVAKVLAREIRGELVPVARVIGDRSPRPPGWFARCVRALMVLAALCGVGWMPARNVPEGLRVVLKRARSGIRDRSKDERRVRDVVRAFRSRSVYVLADARSILAANILAERHGFSVRRAVPADGLVVPFSPICASGLFEAATPYGALESRNLIPRHHRGPKTISGKPDAPDKDAKRRSSLDLYETWGFRRLPPGFCAFGAALKPGPRVARLELSLSGWRVHCKAQSRPMRDGWVELMGCVRIPPHAKPVTLKLTVQGQRGKSAPTCRLDRAFVIPVRAPTRDLTPSRPAHLE